MDIPRTPATGLLIRPGDGRASISRHRPYTRHPPGLQLEIDSLTLRVANHLFTENCSNETVRDAALRTRARRAGAQ